MALFDPHDAKRLGSVGGDAPWLAGRHQRPDHGIAIARGHRDLVGKFAREGNPEQARRHTAAHADGAACHEGESLVRDVVLRVHQLLQDPARIRSGNGELGPAVGGRDQLHIHVGAQALAHKFQMPVDAAGIGRGRGHHVMHLAETRRGAVIHHHPVLAQHQAVAGLADGKGGEGVAVGEVEESAGVTALNVDLAKRADIADADGIAGGQHLAVDGLAPVRLALAREPLRPQPGACLDECRALFGRPVVRRRQPCRAEVAADRAAGKGGDGGRGVGRAIDGGAGLGNRLAGQFGHDGQSQHI